MHHGELFRLWRRYPHPAPDKRACRSSGGVCEVDSTNRVRRAASQKLRKDDARCCIIFTEGYRSGHNEAVLKNSRYCHCKIVKTLDFIGVFVGSSARCEKRFSQFSRKFLAGFSQFPNVFEPILNWFGDYLGQFNSLRRHIEAVITRLS